MLRNLRHALALSTTGLLVVSACSVIVPGEVDPVRCSAEGASGPPACPVGQRCLLGTCTPGSGGEGGGGSVVQPCGAGDSCPGNLFCVDPAALGFTGPKFCTTGCCKSAECGTGPDVCFPTGGGASLCVPGSAVGRPTIGSKPTGAGCADGGECRSGLCSGGNCADTCCASSDCPGNLPDCVLQDVPDQTRRAFMCGVSTGGGPTGAVCSNGSQCFSNACITPQGRCTQSCCRKSNCPASMECIYITNGGFRVCALTGAVNGPKANGEPCTSASDCQSGQCLPLAAGGAFCTDACCRDEDCGDPTQYACRPLLDTSGKALLLCVKR